MICWDSLARQLRRAGWTQHARNLRLRVAEQGIGCAVSVGRRTLRLVVRDGLATALLVRGRDRELVATSDSWFMHIDKAPREEPDEPKQRYLLTLDRKLVERADRLAKAQGRSRSALVRRAVELYLQGRRA